MKIKIGINVTETWITGNRTEQQLILEEAINDFGIIIDNIINIQLIQNRDGTSKFYIYEKYKD